MRILACVFTGKCTREEGGKGCQRCDDYFPVEGRLMGVEVFCHECLFDNVHYAGECRDCFKHSEFRPNGPARIYADRIAKYMEQHPGATVDEARGHGK